MVVVLDEPADLLFQAPGQIVVPQRHHVLKRSVVTLDLALGLRVIRGTAGMDNVLVRKVLTKATGDVAGDTTVTDDFVYVQKVVWYGASTAGHLGMVKNKHGIVLFPFCADAPGAAGLMMYTFEFPMIPHPCDGIHVDDLDSGTLYFYTVGRSTVS